MGSTGQRYAKNRGNSHTVVCTVDRSGLASPFVAASLLLCERMRALRLLSSALGLLSLSGVVSGLTTFGMKNQTYNGECMAAGTCAPPARMSLPRG